MKIKKGTRLKVDDDGWVTIRKIHQGEWQHIVLDPEEVEKIKKELNK